MKGVNEDGICCSTWSIWISLYRWPTKPNMWKEGTASGRGSRLSSVTVLLVLLSEWSLLSSLLLEVWWKGLKGTTPVWRGFKCFNLDVLYLYIIHVRKPPYLNSADGWFAVGWRGNQTLISIRNRHERPGKIKDFHIACSIPDCMIWLWYAYHLFKVFYIRHSIYACMQFYVHW